MQFKYFKTLNLKLFLNQKKKKRFLLIMIVLFRSTKKSSCIAKRSITAQKMKFAIECDQIRRKRGFGHIYWRNP